jgi:hypothetical protein
MTTCLPYAFLASNLDRAQTKMLLAIVAAAKLPAPVTVTDQLTADLPKHLVSVGRSAVAIWHEFGLVRVEGNHGNLFTTHKPTGTFMVMQLHHPGSAMQPTLHGRMDVRLAMRDDLVRFRELLEGRRPPGQFLPQWCAKCLCAREPKKRMANWWLEGADGIGLCDDHWRKRAVIRRKAKKKVNPGSVAGQVPGQLEGFVGGMVAKR